MRSSRAHLYRMRAPIAMKRRRRSSGNWAAWAPAAMRFTRVALVIYGSTALAPPSLASLSRVHFADAISAAVLFREDILRAVFFADRRVLSAIRASASETPANPGMGTRPPRNARERASSGRPRLPPSPFDGLLNALPYRQPSGSTAPRSLNNDTLRTCRGLINGRYEPLTTGARVPPVLSPSPVASIRPSIMSSPSPCRFPRMSRLHRRASAPATPLPPSDDTSPAAPSASPHAFASGARKLQ
ncbi:hypothetical protein K438DRAFT_372702 [Mycena galopus ATCC 62051]|nr:hypothetical protein K438DRAFT_372702 [Mycena galopus ATCC 62051]